MAESDSYSESSGDENGSSAAPRVRISKTVNYPMRPKPGAPPSGISNIKVQTMKFDDDLSEESEDDALAEESRVVRANDHYSEPTQPNMTLKEAQAKRDELAPVVVEQWKTLREIVARHEAAIQNRWVRKSKAKRRAILLEARPDMPKEHNAHVAFWKRHGTGDGKEFHDEYLFLLPHMNLEDLCKAEPLPLLLNSRGRHAPHEFVLIDIDTFHLGFFSDNISTAGLKTHEMVFNDDTSADGYGRLEAMDEKAHSRNWLDPGNGRVSVCHGLNVLKGQAYTYELLTKCCQLIMHDIAADELTGPAHPVAEEPPLVSANTASMSSLANTTFEAIYRQPSSMDIKQLEALVAAQVAQLEDGLWQLRVDPEAWANTVLEVGEHRLERLPDTQGRTHQSMKPAGQDAFWQRVITSIIVDRVVALGVWHVVLEKVQRLRRKMELHGDPLDPTAELPHGIGSSFMFLWKTLMRTEAGPTSTLKVSFPASPPMREHFLRHAPRPSARADDNSAYVKPLRTETPAQKELLETMLLLWGDKRNLVTTSTLLDMLEHLVQREPTARTLTTAHIREQLGQFAVIAECQRQMMLFQPWAVKAATLDESAPGMEQMTKADFVNSTYWMGPLSAMERGSGFAKLGVPTDGRFRYPASNKQTRENVEAMRSAEAALDSFWGAFLQAYERTLSPGLVEVLVRRERPRTKPWATEGKGQGDKGKVMAQDAVTVDKRAAKVFDALFFVPGGSGGSETNWGDFLHAMTSAGLAAEKIYASLWQFKRQGDATAMQIAEPHPSGKMPAVMCRQIGRRLARTYGWERRMFVVEAAEEGQK